MNGKKPDPLDSEPPRKICPICGKPSYSREGIHPQCAVADADAKRLKEIKASQQDKPAKLAKPTRTPRWKKTCPNCGAQVHVRSKTCACGHAFGGKIA